jgi:hypothetical protein
MKPISSVINMGWSEPMSTKIITILGALALAALPAAVAAPNSTSHRDRWPAENLSGRIAAVYPAKDLVIVKDPSGTTFDLIVSPGTRIRAGTEKLTLTDLASKTNGQVSVRYVPERKGDVAASIKLN